jgi:hypothetical protein
MIVLAKKKGGWDDFFNKVMVLEKERKTLHQERLSLIATLGNFVHYPLRGKGMEMVGKGTAYTTFQL